MLCGGVSGILGWRAFFLIKWCCQINAQLRLVEGVRVSFGSFGCAGAVCTCGCDRRPLLAPAFLINGCVRSRCLQDWLKVAQAGVWQEADPGDVTEFYDDFTPTCARLERKRPPSENSTEMRENVVRGFCQM